MTKLRLGKKDIFAPAQKKGQVVVKELGSVKELRGGKAGESAVNSPKPESLLEGQTGSPSVRPPKPESPRTLVTSFRIREDFLERVREYAFFERTNIYEVVNQALGQFLKGYKPKYPHRS